MQLTPELIEKNLQASKDSYMTKEEFMRMLDSLDFVAVKDIELFLVKSFYIWIDEDGEQNVKVLGNKFNMYG